MLETISDKIKELEIISNKIEKEGRILIKELYNHFNNYDNMIRKSKIKTLLRIINNDK